MESPHDTYLHAVAVGLIAFFGLSESEKVEDDLIS